MPLSLEAGDIIATFERKPETILDEVRAGGRIPLVIGRPLTDNTRTDNTREALGLEPSTIFFRPTVPEETGKGFTLAQKMVGKACGLPEVRPGTSCELVKPGLGRVSVLEPKYYSSIIFI